MITPLVQDSIDKGRVKEETGKDASRNWLQITTLLDAIEEHQFDALMGGVEETKKKRVLKKGSSHIEMILGSGIPKNQRPELWNIFNGKKNYGEHFRVFPISNWTEMDVWQYILMEGVEIPSLYIAHEREVVWRNNSWLPNSEFLKLREGERSN